MLKQAEEWLGLVRGPERPVTLGQCLQLCIDMAQSWQAAASIGLNQGAKPEIAFPGNPIPWSSWVAPLRRLWAVPDGPAIWPA